MFVLDYFSPLCGVEVEVKVGESIDDAVSKHIDAGCPKPLKCVTFGCCCPGCRAEEVVPCICNLCGKNTCFKHRFPADHYCKRTYESLSSNPSTASSTATATAATATVKKVEKKPEKNTVSSEQTSRSELFKSMQKNSQKKNGGFMYKLQMSKAKASAQGNQSIPEDNREYLEVVFPLS